MNTTWPYRTMDLFWLGSTAIVYALLEKTILNLYATHSLLTIFWPGTGLALALLLLGGRKFWPAIFLGALLGGVWSGQAVDMAITVSLVRTLEVLLGSWLLTRQHTFDCSLASLPDLYRLTWLAGTLSTAIGAAAGLCVLLLQGNVALHLAFIEFVLWWMADLVGILIMTPLILSWRTPSRLRVMRSLEMGLLLGVTFLVGQIVFLDWFRDIFTFINRGYWLYPLVCWAAIRFGLFGVQLVMLLTSVQALIGAALGIGTYGYSLSSAQIFNFWAHTTILTLIGMVLAIVLTERERINRERQTSEDRFLSLFENMLDGYAHCRLIFEGDKPVDYEFITVNPSFERVTGLQNVVGRKICEVVPGYAQANPDSLRAFADVVRSGVPMRWEHYFSTTDRWFAFAVYRPAPGEFICITENITARKQADTELRKLSQAVMQSPVSVVITDLQGRIQYVNPAFCQVSGYQSDEVLNQNPRVLKSGQTPPQTYDALWAMLSAGQVWRGEFINRTKDGREFIEDATIAPLRQIDGQITHYIGIKSDVTELKHAMAQLRSSEARFQLAKNAAGLGLYDHDLVKDTMDGDERIREFWGIGPTESLSVARLLERIHSADRSLMKAAVDQACSPEGNGKFQVEFRVIHADDGAIRYLRSNGQVFYEEGIPIRAIGVTQDITAQKHLEKEIEAQRHEMESFVNQQIAAQTAAAIAHELNQPLVAISAYSEAALRMLQQGVQKPEKLARALEGAMAQSQRAGQTLNELLNFLHQNRVDVETVDIHEIIHGALAIAQDNRFGRFRTEVELEPDMPLVQVNRLQLQKVLVNLFHNGIEAMHGAGVPVPSITIKVKTAAERNMAQITVQDCGPGLDTETAHRIFDPFFSTKSEGLGLGLAISRALIEANGGQLWAEVNSSPGATFHIALPFAS